MSMTKWQRGIGVLIGALLAVALLGGCGSSSTSDNADEYARVDQVTVVSLSDIPPYSGKSSCQVNGNIPEFSEAELNAPYGTEAYGALDRLGRCTTTFAVVGPETQPTEKRGDIHMIKPTGWQHSNYSFIDGESLYNRCHLLGYQLTGENANERNLITGTRYMNTQGMLPYEDMVDDYIDDTGNHVLMRVTPVFEGDNLIADGVQMEAYSLEDEGEGVSYNVFCYNVQPGVSIDYATGDNEPGTATDGTLSDTSGGTSPKGQNLKDESTAASRGSKYSSQSVQAEDKTEQEYVLNTRSKKFHKPDCPSVQDMSFKNRDAVISTRDKLIEQGYSPCGACKP